MEYLSTARPSDAALIQVAARKMYRSAVIEVGIDAGELRYAWAAVAYPLCHLPLVWSCRGLERRPTTVPP